MQCQTVINVIKVFSEFWRERSKMMLRISLQWIIIIRRAIILYRRAEFIYFIHGIANFLNVSMPTHRINKKEQQPLVLDTILISVCGFHSYEWCNILSDISIILNLLGAYFKISLWLTLLSFNWIIFMLSSAFVWK